MKKRLNPKYFLTVIFLGIIFSIGFLNLKPFLHAVKESSAQNAAYFTEGGTNLESDYRLAFWNRRSFINGYGAAQRLLGRRIIDNVDFALAGNGMLERTARDETVQPFARELLELKDCLDIKEIPLLYIQMPPRQSKADGEPGQLFQTRAYYEQINDVLGDAPIARLDETDILSGDGCPSLTDFYFKTDIHTTTEGEIWMAGKISETLKNTFDITVPEVLPDDSAMWEKRSHSFLGNFAQSVGEYYIGTDVFEEYVPAFPTHLIIRDAFGGWQQEGSFEDVLMNHYDQLDTDETYTYWITNYLRYGQGGYHIENPSQKGPSLLFICDSLCYRTLSYLSLGCSNITVLDPRFYPEGSGNPVEKVLSEKEYDAVIYLHGTFFTTDYSMFGRGEFTSSEEGSGMPGLK